MKCPESIEELNELEKLIPLCKVTLYEQAQARKKKNPDKSDRQISKEIAEEIGRSPDTVRRAIIREKAIRKMETVSPPLELSTEDKKAIEKHAAYIKQQRREQKNKK